MKRWKINSKSNLKDDPIILRRFLFDLKDSNNEYEEFNWTKIAQDTHYIYEKAICKTVAEKQKQEIAQENAKKAKKAGNTETEITNLLSFQKKHAYA